MSRFIFSLLLIASFYSYGQIETVKFGDISLDDLAMEAYPLDSGAEAVYLIDKGEAYFYESGFNIVRDVHIRLKILKESGLSRSDIKLGFYKGATEIQKLKAATYNLVDGKMVTRTVSKKEWVTEKFDNDRRTKKLSFPEVRVGSIIEYSYRQVVGTVRNLPSWNFQNSIPTRYSEYRIDMPKYGTYKTKLKGYHPSAYYNNKGKLFHMVMKDVPALKREPYVSTMENYRSRVEFEIETWTVPGNPTQKFLTNWKEINKALLDSDQFGKVIRSTGQLRRIYPTDKSWGNNKESLIEIYNYVRDHFEYNNRSNFLVAERSKKLWEEGKGDNADINITLAQFLEKAGIEVYPVILSSRGNGYLNKSTPVLRQFNYMIVCAIIDTKRYLLDATDKFRPFDVLPARAINGEGLMVDKFGGRWVDLRENGEMSSKTISGEFGFDEDMEALEGKMQIDFRGIAASRIREDIYEEIEKSKNDVEDEEEEEDKEDDDESETLDDYKTGEIENLEVENGQNPAEKLKVTYDFTTEGDINTIGDKIFMSPVLIKHIDENPFKLEERVFPVEFPAPIADTYVFKIKIPEGYVVEELPKSQNMVLPNKGGKYMFIVGEQDGHVQIMIRLNLSKTTYTPEEYPALKELFNQIVAKQQEQIVFKEK